jgi:hypothetical protein
MARKHKQKITVLIAAIIWGLTAIPVLYFGIHNVVARSNNINSASNTMILTFTSSIFLVGIITGFRHSKYRALTWCFSLGAIVFGLASYIPNINVADLWNYRLLGLAIITIGFAYHTFVSGEYIEKALKRLVKINNQRL